MTSPISIKVTKKSKSVLIDLKYMNRRMKKGAKEAMHDIGVVVGRENKRIQTSGARTGRVYMIKGKRHKASAPGEPPKKRTGRLYKSYDYRVSSWHTMRVGEEAPYAKYLEDGTRRMGGRRGARVHLLKAINKKSGDAVRLFYQKTKAHMRVK